MGALGGGDRSNLSMFDIYGNPIKQTTANCYVVSKPGTYKFPLVFGCALKNGAENPESYTNNGGSKSHDFEDYNGKIITSPYIEEVSENATSVQLSIADTDGIFTDFSIIDGSPCRYVQFSVANVPVTGANGIISIKDDSGIVMWSWHIWVWTDDLTPVEITNATEYKYNILPVNLASKWDDDEHTHIKNWFYQFGRPVPLLCPSAYNSTSDHASYGALRFTRALIASGLYIGIQNPTTFYKYDTSYYNNWFRIESSRTCNLWDASCKEYGNSDNSVVKTVYDPCPVGFKMPNGNTFTYFVKSNVVGSFANGYRFKRHSADTVGLFFPASGFLNVMAGNLTSVGQVGGVYLSSSATISYPYYFQFLSGEVTPQAFGGGRASGFSVRPVQE